LQKRFALLHVAKSPSMALYGLASTSGKSIHGFFGDCRSASHFCMLLSRPPWLVIDWQVRAKKSIHGFSGDCRSASHFCMLLSRHPWLFTGWQVRAKKSIHGFFRVLGCPINSLHSVIPNSFRNLYAICNVDAEIGCKQPRSA
jgi:hypothetical protein